MKHNRLAMLTLPMAALFAFAAPVENSYAQDQFTFSANLDVDQLHEDVQRLGFLCRLCADEQPQGECAGSTLIGQNTHLIPANDITSFHQSVTVAVNVEPGENPQAVVGYWCSLTISNNGSGVLPCFPQQQTSASPPFVQRAENSAFVSQIRGSFNP